MRLTYQCPVCKKNTEIVCEQAIPQLHLYLYSYKCGHSETRSQIIPVTTEYHNITGTKEAYEYQKKGIQFIERTNFRCLVADSMGLGKTIQGLIAVRNANLFPCLVVVPSSTVFQWCKEIQDWCGKDLLAVFPIIGTKTFIVPGFKFYVISMDTFARNGTWKKLATIGFKSSIVDECHKFKDDGSKRTGALVEFYKTTNIARIFLSGTPIKNRASEFFVPLNLLAPSSFPSKARFLREWLSSNEKGQYDRLKPWKIDEFHRLVSRFMIRREKEDVLTNLPPITRDYQFVVTEDEELKEKYNSELDLFQNYLNQESEVTSMGILGWLTHLRQTTAVAKIPLAIDWINQFQEQQPNEKLAVGIHHHAVRDTLKVAYPTALTLSGEDSAIDKDRIVTEFNKPESRLLIINIGAGGLGLNLQTCANSLVLERYWNSADEEQFEGRFHRNGQTRAVIITYLMLSGSIDQWFHEMVEEKRQIFGETINKWNFTRDFQSMKDLAWKTINNKL